MDLDMEAMEAMEGTGPTTLARGLLMLNLRLLLRLNPRLRPMHGMVDMVAMDLDTEATVDMVWDTVPMELDMLVDMEVMEDTGPTTLARGLPNLNPRPMPMRGMVAMDLDTEVMVDMVWDTVHMDLDMLVDMEAMDTDVDIASMVERHVTCSKSTRQTDF